MFPPLKDVTRTWESYGEKIIPHGLFATPLHNRRIINFNKASPHHKEIIRVIIYYIKYLNGKKTNLFVKNMNIHIDLYDKYKINSIISDEYFEVLIPSLKASSLTHNLFNYIKDNKEEAKQILTWAEQYSIDHLSHIIDKFCTHKYRWICVDKQQRQQFVKEMRDEIFIQRGAFFRHTWWIPFISKEIRMCILQKIKNKEKVPLRKICYPKKKKPLTTFQRCSALRSVAPEDICTKREQNEHSKWRQYKGGQEYNRLVMILPVFVDTYDYTRTRTWYMRLLGEALKVCLKEN